MIEKASVPDFLKILKPSSLFAESDQVRSILFEEKAIPFKLDGDLMILAAVSVFTAKSDFTHPLNKPIKATIIKNKLLENNEI